MSNFFNEEQLSNITLKENNIENVKDFSRANPNTTLGELPKYEDLYKKEIIPTKNIDVTQFNETVVSPITSREFKKQEDREKAIIRARVKIFLTVFALITLLVTGFLIYNLISMINLNNKVENNNIKIKIKREQLEKEEKEQPASISTLVELPKDLNIFC